jgi:hypothetical protein
VTGKIARHLNRFADWLTAGLGHDCASAVTPRKVAAWRDHLAAEGSVTRDGTATVMASATVNNHLAHLSALFYWITVHAPPGCCATAIRPRMSSHCGCPHRRFRVLGRAFPLAGRDCRSCAQGKALDALILAWQVTEADRNSPIFSPRIS